MTKITLNGVEVTLTQEQIDQILKEHKEKKGYPHTNTEYFSVTYYGWAQEYNWENNNDEEFMFDIGNYYATKEEAEKAAEKLQALARIRKYIRENDLGVETDWSDHDQDKFFIVYPHDEMMLNWGRSVTWQREDNIGYLKSAVAARQVIDNCKDDLLTYFGVTK